MFRWDDTFTCHLLLLWHNLNLLDVIQSDYIQGVLGHAQRAVMAWLACFSGLYEHQLPRASDGVITWQRSTLAVVRRHKGSGLMSGGGVVVCLHLCTAVNCKWVLWDIIIGTFLRTCHRGYILRRKATFRVYFMPYLIVSSGEMIVNDRGEKWGLTHTKAPGQMLTGTL